MAGLTPLFIVGGVIIGQEATKGESLNPNQELIPGTRIPFEWFYYRPKNQQRVFMPVERFLYLTPPPVGGFSKSSLKYFDEHYGEGRNPMESAWMDVDVDKMTIETHEGRHRAYWLWKKGVKDIPVVIFHNRRYDGRLSYVEPEFEIDVDRLRPERGPRAVTDISALDYAKKEIEYGSPPVDMMVPEAVKIDILQCPKCKKYNALEIRGHPARPYMKCKYCGYMES